MTLRLRRLTLRANTERGPYARDLVFGDGLTVLRGRNSRGKSTCLMSFLYALGLEGMLTAKRQVPLPHAVTEYLEDDDGEVAVLASDVTVVIENAREERLTVRRQIKGGADGRLLRTWAGEVDPLSASADASKDYFVRDPGAAQRDAGFHYFLAQYIGWSLPEVARFEGAPVRLYLEMIFPLLFVEQKRGWLGLQARMPTYLGVRDPQTRAVEFLLGLHPNRAITQRARVELEIQRAQEEWNRSRAAALAAARSANGDIIGVPDVSGAPWPDRPQFLRVPDGPAWITVADAVARRVERLQKLEGVNVPTAAENAEALTLELAVLAGELGDLDALASKLDEDLELAQLERTSADARLGALQRDLQRNKDAQKLRTLGSISRLSVSKEHCPTCHQAVAGHLLDKTSLTPMSLEDNVAFIEEMRATVEAASGEASRRISTTRQRIVAVDEQRVQHRSRLRRLKRALTQDERAPSLADVEERVRLENEIERLNAASTRFNEAVRELHDRHMELERLRTSLAAVHVRRRTPQELAVLRAFERSFVEQVAAYGLTSLQDAKLSIDSDSYRPRAEGMPDLEFELSGSDLIRAIWAYYLALLETGREHATNHPGILVFDEPQQQGTAAQAVGAMLRRAASALGARQQILIASSEPREVLQEQLRGLSFSELDLDSWALQRTST